MVVAVSIDALADSYRPRQGSHTSGEIVRDMARETRQTQSSNSREIVYGVAVTCCYEPCNKVIRPDEVMIIRRETPMGNEASIYHPSCGGKAILNIKEPHTIEIRTLRYSTGYSN